MFLTFQEIILNLNNFWSKNNCLILQPLDIEIGAGTSHYHTFFRAIDKKNWRSAYVQPVRRPRDGRYAKNSNRLQHYYQYQVIIKPTQLNLIDLYLSSLNNLGLDLRKNDIRFIEDNWENPTLGAWGLGWEVWLNGIEITQFTYFQCMGGIVCVPTMCEITYGLERLAMNIQEIDSVFKIKWNEKISYGDIFFQNEVEHSKSNFENMNEDILLNMFENYLLESNNLLKFKLIIPSYEMLLKSIHIFNILDSRFIFSSEKRVIYITRIRNVSNTISSLYVKYNNY